MKTKIQDIKLPKKTKQIPFKLIITNYKPLDGRTKVGKPIKRVSKIIDFTLYLITCAAISFMITTLLITWIA